MYPFKSTTTWFKNFDFLFSEVPGYRYPYYIEIGDINERGGTDALTVKI